jgi:WD40 repeat protein
LVCIQEERVDAGTYTNGQPYQLVNWSVRLVQGSEPIVIADTQLEGSNVPYAITTFGGDCSTPNAACTPIVGIPPSAELNKWLLTLFGDATFLIPEAGIITGAVYAPAGQTVISSMMEETELFRPPEQTGRMDFQNFLIYWDPKTGKATRTVDLGIINGQTVFSPDGKTLVSYELGKIRSWDATTGRLLHTATTTVEFIESKIRALSPDGKILATTDYLGGDIDLWNTTTGEMLFSLESDNLTEGRPIAFSPDGLILAAGGNDPRSPGWDPEIRLWDVMRGNILLTLKPNGAQVDSVAFSPDGKILASGVSDGTIKLWDVASGRELISFSGSNDPINDIEFSPSGKTFASGSDEGTVKLWDIEEGALLLTFNASFVDSIFFAPDGRTLVTTHVGLMKLWNVGAR